VEARHFCRRLLEHSQSLPKQIFLPFKPRERFVTALMSRLEMLTIGTNVGQVVAQ